MSIDSLERMLAPILDSAYRTALCLTSGPEAAEALLRETARRGVSQAGRVPPGDFRHWFLGLMIDALRADGLAPWRAPAKAPTPTGVPVAASDADVLVAALRALPPDDRVIGALYFSEGLGCREIAGVVACPLAAIHQRVGSLRAEFRPLVAAMPRREPATGSVPEPVVR